MEQPLPTPQSTAASNIILSPSQSAGRVFHLFKKFTLELQDEIWQHAVDGIGQRVVEFREGLYRNADGVAIEVLDDKYQRGPTDDEFDMVYYRNQRIPTTASEGDITWEPRFTSTCPIPALLHTTHGSRKCALKRWELAFAQGDKPSKVFFDFTYDTLVCFSLSSSGQIRADA